MSTINFKILPVSLYQSAKNAAKTVQAQSDTQPEEKSNQNLYNANYELDEMLSDWRYAQYSVTGNSELSSDKSKVVDCKVQEYYEQFKNREISFDEFVSKIKNLEKKYPSYVSINIAGYTAEVKTGYSTFYAVDPVQEEIMMLWKSYFENKITTIAFTEELAKISGVSDVELDYSVPSMEKVSFTVNGKYYNFTKARTGFNFDKQNNILHGPSVYQELQTLGFSKAEIEKYFKKQGQVKAAHNAYSYKMRNDIHIEGKIVSDLMELRDLVVIKKLQEE